MGEIGLRIRFAATDDAHLAALAPAHWRRKATEKRFAKDRNQELVAGGLLVDMLAEFFPGLADPEITVDPSGKPSLCDFPGIHFSISHTDGMVMCAVADHLVGCDVERIVPLDDDLKKAVGSLGAWTKREAHFKCGEGAGESRIVSAPAGYCAAISEGGVR